MSILLKPCKIVYHFIKYFFSGLKYFFLGLKYFPLIIGNMLLSILYLIKMPFINKKPKEKKKKHQEKQDRIEQLGSAVIKAPKKINKQVNKVPAVKKAKKKKDQELTPMVIDFNGPEAVKSKDKVTYEYKIKDPDGKMQTGYFDAHSVVDVHSYLTNEGNTVYSIKTSKFIQMMYGSHGASAGKFKTKDLIFLLAQLSTYIKAGIPLADAMKILVRQFKSKNYKKILGGVVYDLSIGKSFSEALINQGNAFPRLLINMIKTSEMTGELPETLDDMENYYTETESTRKAMVSALMYPVIIFFVAIAVGGFIMIYVVPQFVEIYESMDTELPGITKFVLWLSDFLSSYAIWLGLGFVAVLALYIYIYKNVRPVRRASQWLAMHIPGFSSVLIYNEVNMFTKTFASLLSHNVFITDTMEILNKVTNNEIYKEMITEAITCISKGGKISTAFKGQWAFPIPAYEMIVTGERTGQLPEMMNKVAAYYQDLHKNAVARIKAFVEPALIIMLTVMVGVIVLAIVIPMFDMYSAIQT